MLTRLILVNLGMFLLVLLLKIVSYLFNYDVVGGFITWTALPSDLVTLATRPWTLVTYMFLHESFFHILFNMLWLYFAGKLFLEYFGERTLLSTYLIGGLLGGLLYVISYNVFPIFQEQGVVDISNNRGASAGVMAVVIAIAAYNPKFPVNLFFVLRVPIWVVGALALLADLIYLGEGNNAGGHIAHLGGAAFGFLLAKNYQNGNNISEGFSQFLDQIFDWFKPKPKVRKVYANKTGRTRKKSNQNNDTYSQQRIDEILDKISRSGYDSLTKEEKDYLFKIGKD